MSLITEDDLNKLSEEDLKLIIEYFKDELDYENKLKNLDPENIKERELLIARKIGKELTSPYSKERTGLKVYNDIINNKTVYEHCCFHFDYVADLIDDSIAKEKERFVLKFKKNKLSRLYTVNEFKKKELELMEVENRAKNSELFCEIADLKITEFSLNIEKYELQLTKTEGSIKLDFGFNLNKTKEFLKQYNDNRNFKNLILLHQSGIIESLGKKFSDCIQNYGFSIIECKKRLSLSEFIISFDQNEYEFGEEFTLNRQVYAINLLLNKLGANQIDNTKKARFIQFITRRNLGDKKINGSELYKKLTQSILSEPDKIFLENQFKDLGFNELVEIIKKN